MASKPLWFWILLGSAFLFALVWEQIQSVRLGYDVETLRARAQTQEQKNAYLRIELERLRAPQAIAAAARERLKMGPPSPEAVITLGAERGLAAPRTPSLMSRLFLPSREQH